MKNRCFLRSIFLPKSPVIENPIEVQAKLAEWSGRNLWKMNLQGSENWSFLTCCKEPCWDDVVDLARYDWFQFERDFSLNFTDAQSFWSKQQSAFPKMQASFPGIFARAGHNYPVIGSDSNDSTFSVGLTSGTDPIDRFDKSKRIRQMQYLIETLKLGSIIDVQPDGFRIHCKSSDNVELGEIRFGATQANETNSGFLLKGVGRTDEYIELFSDIYEEFVSIVGPPERLFVNSCCEPTDVHDHVGRLGPDYGPCRIRVRGKYKKRFDPTKRPKETDPPRVYPLHLWFDNDISMNNLVLQVSVCHEDDGSYLILESDLASELLDRVVDEFGLTVVESRWEADL